MWIPPLKGLIKKSCCWGQSGWRGRNEGSLSRAHTPEPAGKCHCSPNAWQSCWCTEGKALSPSPEPAALGSVYTETPQLSLQWEIYSPDKEQAPAFQGRPPLQVSPAEAIWTPGQLMARGPDLNDILLEDQLHLTICRYSRIIFNLSSPPLFSSFCSMLLIILQEALLAPITFLYATESRFLSSTVNSTSIPATFFIDSTISRRKRSGNYSHNLKHLSNHSVQTVH